MRELRVEDALLYLDQVKIEFGDRPHVYNEFLDIMKHFKAQMIDTPGVIQRVSNLFSGNKRLVLGFNTFLPEGYKIELDAEGNTIASQVGVPGTVTLATASGAPVPQPQSTMGVGLGMAVSQQQQQPQPQPQSIRPLNVHSQQPQQQQSPVVGPASIVMAGLGGMAGAAGTVSATSMPSRREGPTGFRQIGRGGGAGGGILPNPPSPTTIASSNANNLVSQQQQQQQQHQVNLLPSPPPIPPSHQPAAQPVEFDHAINYVTTIKKRFASQPQIYKSFLEILHTYQKEQRGIEQVLEDVSDLFGDHPDLLREFCYFLPDGVQQQARRQLEEVVKMRQNAAASSVKVKASRQSQVKPRIQTPPVPIPFGASQGRSEIREREIQRMAKYGSVSFLPRRPPRRGDLKPKDMAPYGRPTSIPDGEESTTIFESTWLENAKQHLLRKELSSPSNILASQEKKHTPWTEFCKCLHLFASGILNKEELVLLLEGLFKQGHAPKSGVNAGGGAVFPHVAEEGKLLMKEFEELLLGRGPYADQCRAEMEKEKYGHLRVSDIEFDKEDIEKPTPNYYFLPADFPDRKCTSQTNQDKLVLNSSLVCPIRRSMRDDYARCTREYSIYTMKMFNLEDERFEVDMAINRNSMAINNLEPIDQEVRELRSLEDKEGQPFGRISYKLKHGVLSQNTINAIARIYTSRNPEDNYQNEILHQLNLTPIIAIPLVFQRLKQKNAEWRRVKSALVSRWQRVSATYYGGISDVLCAKRQKILLNYFEYSSLVDECQNVRDNSSYDVLNELLSQEEVIKFNSSAELNHRCLAFTFDVPTSVHNEIFSLLYTSNDADNKNVWSDCIAPLFGLNQDVFEKMIEHEKKSSKLSIGQIVSTAFGSGPIVSVRHDDDRIKNYKPIYEIALSFGKAFVIEDAIFNINDETQCDGRESYSISHVQESELLIQTSLKNYAVFVTEDVYVFVRLYTAIMKILMIVQRQISHFRNSTAEESNSRLDCSRVKENQIKSLSDFIRCIRAFQSKLEKIHTDFDKSEIENECRHFAKDKMYLISALPDLTKRCLSALAGVSNNKDTITSLFKCCLKDESDFTDVLTQALNISKDANYCIQFKQEECPKIVFTYVPVDSSLTESSTLHNDADERRKSIQLLQLPQDPKIVNQASSFEDEEMKERDSKRLKTQ